MVAAVKPAAKLIAWRYIRNDSAVVVVTATGSHVVTIDYDEGDLVLGDSIDGLLADELIAEIGRHDANNCGLPGRPKYDASIAIPPCLECNDEGFTLDEDLTGREQRYACTLCDPDGSGLDDLREQYELRDCDRRADEAAEMLEQDVRF